MSKATDHFLNCVSQEVLQWLISMYSVLFTETRTVNRLAYRLPLRVSAAQHLRAGPSKYTQAVKTLPLYKKIMLFQQLISVTFFGLHYLFIFLYLQLDLIPVHCLQIIFMDYRD